MRSMINVEWINNFENELKKIIKISEFRPSLSTLITLVWLHDGVLKLIKKIKINLENDWKSIYVYAVKEKKLSKGKDI